MKIFFFLLFALCSLINSVYTQNVFNPADPIVRYDSNSVLGSATKPNPTIPGLQKWVSTPTNGISVGSGSLDVTSFKQYLINYNGTPMAFRIKFPKSYANIDSVNKKYPLMLFLHGAGEVGCPSNNGIYNNEKQLYLGGGLFRDFVNNNIFDGFLLYPQLVNKDGCWGAWGTASTANFTAVIAMIDSMVKYVRVDIDRVLCNGLSGGGYGAWRIADIFPQRIAKIIPSAAAGSTNNRTNFVHIPIWFATGGKDPDPSPAQALYSYNRMKDIGANIRYTQYPDLGHAVWYAHWREPDYPSAMNDMHKANPLVFFQRNEFCQADSINAKLGITQGFYAYEWQKDGLTIATRANGINNVLMPEYVISYAGNEINVKAFGTYSVRFKRTATSDWSIFSPKPAIVKLKSPTIPPPITINGTRSNVLPALDGNTTVPLQMPAGYFNYQWYRVTDSVLVATTQIYNAPVGTYIARYSEQYGCGSLFSPNYTVVDANGSPQPDPAVNLTSTPVNLTSIKLSWTQGNNETGFEVYRSLTAGGPYKYVSPVTADAISFLDTGLNAGTTYYYIMRSVNGTGASVKTNESVARTLADLSAPTAPSNLTYRGSTATTVLLRWTASTDNVSIRRYDIYANNVKMFSTAQTNFTVFDLDSLKSYSFVVKAVDNSDNESAPSNQVTGYTHRQGINYRYYTSSVTWPVLPDFNTLTPVKTGVTDSVNINDTRIKTEITRFGFVWEGLIYIPVSSSYTFETRSDDGSKVYIDVPYSSSAIPLVNNDSIHGIRSRFGTINLAQGYHTIAIAYFQGTYGYDMELWWTNNNGLVREKVPKNFFTFAPASVEPAPKLPNGLTATAIAYNKIGLSWNDVSINETGFEVVRSATSTGTYVPVGTALANSTSFTDSGLIASKAYYYKIRAISSGGESLYSGYVSATTPAAPVTPVAPAQLCSTGGANNSIALTWQDNSTNETGYRIYRSTDGNLFTLLTSLGANNNAYSDLSTTALTLYYYYVAGYNGAGEGTKSNIVQIKAGNNAPVITSPANMYGKSGQTVTQDFTITDDPGDVVTVKMLNKPAFMSIENAGGSLYRITANPTLDNVGFYSFSIAATDNNGASSTSTFSLVVADAKTRSVFVNLGAVGKTAVAPWNNWLGNRAAGNVISNLKDENNISTTFTVTTVNAWSGTTILGHLSGNNSGIVPDAVLESGLADNGTPKTLRIGGLNPSMLYNLEFIGSQNEGLIATAQYATSSQFSSLDARYNTTRSADLTNLVPDPLGQITVTISRTNSSAYTYLNAIVIEEIDPSVTILNPGHLYAEPISRTSAYLTWSDRTNMENASNGYEIQRATDSLFNANVTTISLPANTTSYADSSLSPNIKYWYRIRAINDANASEYSNKFSIVTPSSIVLVNFNSTIANAVSPWNNLQVNPLTEFIVDNLFNQAGYSSGMKLTCAKIFNGEFTAGVNTGANTGVVPDLVLQSNFWLDNSQVSQLKLSGLNHTRKYRIGFTGSSSSTGWFKGNYTATYTVNGKTVYLNSWMNSTKIVYISDLVPDANGELLINFSTTAAAQWGFNAGMIITDYSDVQGASVLYMSNSTIEPIPAVQTTLLNSNKVKIYPNPFSDNINIDFDNLSASNKISAEIYDITGRLVMMQHYSSVPAGKNTLRVSNIRSNGTGVYVVALKVNGKTFQAVKLIRRK
ncbi:MAG TPA: fibronectin type III domain-containing protein [Flavitalea sp.]|nr:fibronectin type III domain-containing protein [Flavitalea sp.]